MKKILQLKAKHLFFIALAHFLIYIVLNNSNLKLLAVTINFLYSIFYYGWGLLVGINLHKLNKSRKNWQLYIFLLSLLVLFGNYLKLRFSPLPSEVNFEVIDAPNYFTKRSLLHLWVAPFNIFYIYFLTLSLTSVEKNKTSFSSTLLRFLFLPIGIWNLQPRIQKVVFKEKFKNQLNQS